MEPLKEMFNKQFYEKLANEFQKADKNFNAKKFVTDVTKNMEQLELNGRLRNTSVVLNQHLSTDYKKSVELMKRVIPNMGGGYTNLVFPDYVGLYGKENFDFSLDALKYFTQFGSSEFAIREYLKEDFNRTIKEMKLWAGDKNHHVRRLASEGSRPRLPWSFKLDKVIADPKNTLPILEKLNNDSELYVRKSVANHLNDISKDHPDVYISVLKNWKGKSTNTDWILKHAGRTLLKKGDVTVLSQFGVKPNKNIEVKNFLLESNKVKIGNALSFKFSVKNSDKKPVKVRIEYAIYFNTSSGELSKKVFKISERELEGLSSINVERKQSFKPITTRKYYKGLHRVSIIVNGVESTPLDFALLA